MNPVLHPLTMATNEFGRVMAEVGDAHLEATTPCEGWDVRDLIGHIVHSNEASAAMVRGCAKNEAMALFGRPSPTGTATELRTRYETGVSDQLAAFSEDGAMERTVHHAMGDIPATQLLGFRIGDHALHAWDLARAIGADENLDPDLVKGVYEGLWPMKDAIASTGMFGDGPSGTVGDDAPIQERLLDLAGRRP